MTISCAVAVTAQVWEYLKSGLGSRNTVKFLEAKDVIFIKNLKVFLLPKPARKYSRTNCHRSQLELSACWTVQRVPIKLVNGTT